MVRLDELDAAVDARVRELLQAAPGAVAAAKDLVRGVSGRPRSVRELECERIAERRASAEGQEGLRAFLEKRKPGWDGGLSGPQPFDDGSNSFSNSGSPCRQARSGSRRIQSGFG